MDPSPSRLLNIPKLKGRNWKNIILKNKKQWLKWVNLQTIDLWYKIRIISWK